MMGFLGPYLGMDIFGVHDHERIEDLCVGIARIARILSIFLSNEMAWIIGSVMDI